MRLAGEDRREVEPLTMAPAPEFLIANPKYRLVDLSQAMAQRRAVPLRQQN